MTDSTSKKFYHGEIRTFAFDELEAIDGGNAYKKLERDGWMVCDGRSLPIAQYRKLFEAIGNNWGSEDKGISFKIPDLRGHFLRGRDGGAKRDPDAAGRSGIHQVDAPNDYQGATGDRVGSVQEDELKSHSHTFDAARHYGADPGDHARAKPSGRGGQTNATGGNETRPRNAYVMYCIYVGS